MSILPFADNPFDLHISFHVLIEHLEKVAAEQTGYAAERAASLLKEIEPYPQLRTGLSEVDQVNAHLPVIDKLLADLFPPALSHNEIKAVTVPFQPIVINRTERLKKIMEEAGPDFDLSIRDFDKHQYYVMSSSLILNELYHTNIDLGKPMFFDIPSANGIMKHYRILYNADFLEIIPTEKAIPLTDDDITLLINNYDDLELWQSKFPPGSYLLKGFAIMNLFDATIENAVSSLKETLLSDMQDVNIESDFQSIFRSIYRIPDLQVGFTAFDSEENKFMSLRPIRKIHSFMLNNSDAAICTDILGPKSYQTIIGKSGFFAITDSRQFFLEHPDSELAHTFLEQGIQSFILAPVVKDDVLLGVLELASPRPRELNSVNAHKLEIVMPFMVSTIDRKITNRQNHIQAIIQNEYTSLHPSVQWKFRKEVEKYMERRADQKDHELKEIVFEDVYPLYGQIDIKGSTEVRNRSTQKDLTRQLTALIGILRQLHGSDAHASSFMQKLLGYRTETEDSSLLMRTDTEQQIQYFIDNKVHPLLDRFADTPEHQADIARYYRDLDKHTGSFYAFRRKYDATVSGINQKMVALLDARQQEAQQQFPHYYERFKSDGVEHNLYIGASIAHTRAFLPVHFHNLRLWQLRTLSEMEQEHQRIKNTLPYTLEVTTLILAYSNTLSIRFRMDEKRFDVDGTYNARFEIVKKRIDKARIKGSHERITQPGKVTIVYAHPNEEREYRGHIAQLQAEGLLGPGVEHLEVEDLQSISGLKALRVAIVQADGVAAKGAPTTAQQVSAALK